MGKTLAQLSVVNLFAKGALSAEVVRHVVSRGPPQPRAPLDPEPRLNPEVFLSSAPWTAHSGGDLRIKMDRTSKSCRFRILLKSDGQKVTQFPSFQAK